MEQLFSFRSPALPQLGFVIFCNKERGESFSLHRRNGMLTFLVLQFPLIDLEGICLHQLSYLSHIHSFQRDSGKIIIYNRKK